MYKKKPITKHSIQKYAEALRKKDLPKNQSQGKAIDAVFDPQLGRIRIVYEARM